MTTGNTNNNLLLKNMNNNLELTFLEILQKIHTEA